MLEGPHFQNAYICRNLAEANAEMRKLGATRDLTVIPIQQTVQTPNGPKQMDIKAGLTWINNLQYELIEVASDEVGIYGDWTFDGPLGFHHICTKIDDWDDFRARVDRQDLPLVMEATSNGGLKFLYLDARGTLGHYLEYVWVPDQMWEMMKGM